MTARNNSTAFLWSYIGTALWSSTDENGTPLDDAKDRDDLAPETLAQMEKDCIAFQAKAGRMIETLDQDLAQIAHDFWLTRNRHGAGFWDGDYPDPYDKMLTEIAHSFGEFDLYIGADGKIHGN